MGRIIIFDTGYQSVSAIQDLLEVKFSGSQGALLHRAKVMQSSQESVASAEQVQINIKRASNSYFSGSGGGTATETKLASASNASSVTSKLRNNTYQASGGTIEVVEPGVFNILGGEWEFCPVPELRLPFAPNEGVLLSLDEAAAEALTLRAILEIEFLVG